MTLPTPFHREFIPSNALPTAMPTPFQRPSIGFQRYVFQPPIPPQRWKGRLERLEGAPAFQRKQARSHFPNASSRCQPRVQT
jgi:hypothetical protein